MEELRCNFNKWFDFATNECKATFKKTVPIIVHGYAYIVRKKDQGLQQIFARKGYKPGQNAQTMKKLIDQFNGMLNYVANARDHVHYVDLRSTLTKGDWYDEIHPSLNAIDEKILPIFWEVIDKL